MKLREGRASYPDQWSELWWLGQGLTARALRRSATDGLWYITTGYVGSVTVRHGPFKSREAAEMLIEMGELDVEA